jgi:formylglycine-generating enzyme required for sulfatase activity
MRIRELISAALLLVSCNSILGNADYHVIDAAPAKCRLNTNCATGEVCIFQTCGPPCDGDADCAKGSRCLKTDTGTACVSAIAATCDAGCPAGTTCSPTDGACRNACDTTQCLTDQTCTNGLCVGTAQHETGSGGSGSGGSAGSGGSGGSGNPTAGSAGAAVVDPCLGKVCDMPSAPSCKSASELTTYDKIGSCSNGTCNYTSHAIPCACQADACITDPCLAVTCASPQPPACEDANTLTTFAAMGTCDAGSCSYAPQHKTCPFGCSAGACNPDPCQGVSCNRPPPDKCKDVNTQTSFAAHGTCNGGTCTYPPTDQACGANAQCGGGTCSVCTADTSCGATCVPCGGTTKKCKDLGTTSKCVACLSNADCVGTTPICNLATNTCQAQPSCAGLQATCGPSANASCCTSNLVTGGTFNRDNNASFPATIANFRLDNYEITVGRFRKFVAAYSQTMASGVGKNPNNPNDTGWKSAWNANLPTDPAALKVALKCHPTYQTWTDTAGSAAAESLPINCITWFEAQAFCIWDGGRLPTYAEWNYAEVGGTAQRTYPWGASAPDCSHANFFGASGGTDYCVSPGTGAVNRVGSESTAGDGFYGQSDLAGNLWDWTQDDEGAYMTPCDNCANTTADINRIIGGGGFTDHAPNLAAGNRLNTAPSNRVQDVGARCARTP